MVIAWALSWWYGAGWKVEFMRLRDRLASSYDYFSIGLLLKTLFSPYKQISAGQVSGPLDVKLRAFIDRLMSRIIGSFIRTIVIFVGCLWILVQTIVGLLGLIAWLVVPVVPIIGFILMVAGLVPPWM